jgi:hypothetical protein
MLGLCGFLEHEETIENQQFRFMPLGLLPDRLSDLSRTGMPAPGVPCMM